MRVSEENRRNVDCNALQSLNKKEEIGIVLAYEEKEKGREGEGREGTRVPGALSFLMENPSVS